MKANELRIGNVVMFNKEVRTVEGMTHVLVKAEYKPFDRYIIYLNYINLKKVSSYVENLEPVPITNYWFKMFKFRTKGKDLLYSYGKKKNCKFDLRVSAHADYEDYLVITIDDPNVIMARMNYVHQLQNLYFALTGEELELKK